MALQSAPHLPRRRHKVPAQQTSLKPSEVNQKVIAAAEKGDPQNLLFVIQQHLDHMNMVNLSTSIHRLVKCADKDPEVSLFITQNKVFEDLQEAILARLHQSRGSPCLQQSLSNITWSLAHLYAAGPKLLILLAQLSTEHIEGFKPFELSMLLWGFAKLGVAEAMPSSIKALFQAGSTQVLKSLGQFSFRSLAMITWAFATARQRDRKLFAGLANEMRRTSQSANCQEIGNTVWAFASAGQADKKLMATMAQAAIPVLREFKAQEISNMLWGFATLGFWHESVFLNSIEVACDMELGSQHLAIILWSFAKVMPKHTATQALVERFAPLCVARLGAFKPQEVSSTLQALVKVILPGKDGEDAEPEIQEPAPIHPDILVLLESLAQWVACNAHTLTAAYLSYAVSSLVLLGNHAQRRVDLVLQPVIVQRVDSFSPSDMLALLQAFLHREWLASSAISMLGARMAGRLNSLPKRDFQALTQLCMSVTGFESEPSQEDLLSWCLALAANLPLAAPPAPDEDTAEVDAEAIFEPQDSDFESSSHGGSCEEEDAACCRSYGVETAESLPFLDWHCTKK